MATTNSPPLTPELEKRVEGGESSGDNVGEVQAAQAGQPGFVGLLVKSVFEPGANPAVVLAMNLSFFFLLLTLFGLAFLTDWNKHVLILIAVNLGLWIMMVWFVMELTRVQKNPENMPLADPLLAETPAETTETRKDR